MHKQTDGRTDSLTDRQSDRQPVRQTDRRTDGWTDYQSAQYESEHIQMFRDGVRSDRNREFRIGERDKESKSECKRVVWSESKREREKESES